MPLICATAWYKTIVNLLRKNIVCANVGALNKYPYYELNIFSSGNAADR